MLVDYSNNEYIIELKINECYLKKDYISKGLGLIIWCYAHLTGRR